MGKNTIQKVIRKRHIDLTVVRPGAESVTDGIPSQPPLAPVVIKGHIQPLTKEQLRHLPEGQDSRNTRVIWTIDDFNAIELNENDEVTDPDDGQILVVQDIEHWREGGFREAIVLRRSGDLV